MARKSLKDLAQTPEAQNPEKRTGSKIPNGKWKVKVIRANFGQTKSENKYDKFGIHLEVTAGPHKGAKEWDNLTVIPDYPGLFFGPANVLLGKEFFQDLPDDPDEQNELIREAFVGAEAQVTRKDGKNGFPDFTYSRLESASEDGPSEGKPRNPFSR